MKERPTNAWLSIGAYARTYGVSRPTVKKWLTAGLLETYRFMGVTRIKNLEPAKHQTLSVSDADIKAVIKRAFIVKS